MPLSFSLRLFLSSRTYTNHSAPTTTATTTTTTATTTDRERERPSRLTFSSRSVDRYRRGDLVNRRRHDAVNRSLSPFRGPVRPGWLRLSPKNTYPHTKMVPIVRTLSTTLHRLYGVIRRKVHWKKSTSVDVPCRAVLCHMQRVLAQLIPTIHLAR